MNLEYTRVGDYLLPSITLNEPSSAPPLGKYGHLHKRFLQEHRPALYSKLLLSERLYPLCREVDKAAKNRLRTISNSTQAHEIILSEIVYL